MSLLAQPCSMCHSIRWCGRACTNAPKPSDAIDVANDVANLSGMANGLANDTPASTPGRKHASTTYRYRNPDKRRLYQREIMRKRRASGRAA